MMGWYLRRSIRLGLVVIGLIMLGAWLAHGGNETLVDLLDTKGRRTGSAVVDPGTGHVDFFDTAGRRTGWGRLDSSGRKVERFGLDGTRQGETVLPVPITPKPKSPR